MTREDKVAYNYARERLDNDDYPVYSDEYELECAFKAGIEYANRWISVEDKLPPLRQGVLAYNGVTMYIAWVSDDFVWRTHKEHCFRTYPVTHWMPLPAPPTISILETTGEKGGEK